jgi:hypothetical protein
MTHDIAPKYIFCFFLTTYAQFLQTALATLLSTQIGLIFLAGQQPLTRAQVAKQPQVAAFRLSSPA